MTGSVFRLGVLKLGCIGAAPLLDLLLDERADREDLEVFAFTSGAKLDDAACAKAVALALESRPDLMLLVSPNAALPGPKAARAALAAAPIPVITISDGPSKKAFFKKNDAGKQVMNCPDGQGFFVVTCDPMIGARREFLDPTEMALFNADVIKVLSTTGVVRLLQTELDALIDELRRGSTEHYPRLVVKAEQALAAANFSNPYAQAKAIAAFTIAETVATLTAKACFVEQDASRYIPLAAAGHEMLRAAASLADDARELEKSRDSVYRTPHATDGALRSKTQLMAKPL